MILPFSWRGTPTVVQQFGDRLPHYMIPFAQCPFNEMREVAVYVWDYRKLKGETPPKRTVIMPAISWKTRKRAA